MYNWKHKDNTWILIISVIKNLRCMLFTLLIFLHSGALYAQNIGVNGATYPIAEPDAYQELMDKVKKTDWQRIFSKYKQSVSLATSVSLNLGKARQDRTFYVDPTYTLPYDITDENGKVIYPQGFSFNPLDYISFPYTLVFINANSVTEIAWLKKQKWFTNYNTMIFITQGDVLRAEKLLDRVVFAANSQMIQKFHISKTPSIMTVQNRAIVISEIGVYGRDGKK